MRLMTVDEIKVIVDKIEDMVGKPVLVNGEEYDLRTDITRILNEKGYLVVKSDAGVMYG